VNRPLYLALIASCALFACSSHEEPTPKSASATKSEAAASKAEAAAPVAAAPAPTQAAEAPWPPNTGKLVQAIQAGGYTYGEVEGPQGQRIWIAGGQIDAQPGDMVQWGQYAVMHNFNAKSLNRTFDNILFVNSWGRVGGPAGLVAAHGSTREGQPALASPHGAAGSPHGAAGGAMPAMASEGPSGIVKSATTAGGYTYLEVDKDGETLWIAAPETTVKAGDKVRWSGGMIMRNFTAKSLDRTFDQIVFSGGVSVIQ